MAKDGTGFGAGRVILVVEDNAGDRATIRRLLQKQKRRYTIVEAATGDAGLERCRTSSPDCVLLDFHLSDMDGNEFLATLRLESANGVQLPVVMLSGQEDDAIAAAALKNGAQDYLEKDTLTGPVLARSIENAIEKFQIRRDLEEQRAAVEQRNQRLELLRVELEARMLELGDATKAKDRFLAVMSHEMRTPLNAILGYAELLDMGLEGALTDGQRRQVERIRVGSRHLLDLTNDVLDLTRADARRLEMDLRPVNLDAIVEEVVALLGSQAEAKGVTLTAEECGSEIPHVQADLQRLRQVLTNLVGNALKFTDEGSVRVRCLPPQADGMVRVDVTDTGIGIDVDVLPLVFNEFYQAKGDLTRRHGGSGLGLAISRRLAHLMGGDILATSEIGKGSTFTLLLPAATTGAELRPGDVVQHDARMAAHQAEIRRRPAAPGAVTVVAFGEDSSALEELARRVSPAVRLLWTTNPEAVTALASRERATLVVLDAGSAGDAAWRAAGAMQDIPELAATAVLLLPSLSAAMPDEAPEVLDLGWVSLVPKPFTAAQLSHAVSTAAGSGSRTADADLECWDVLVVDDDPDSRRVASRFLSENSNVCVREAPDGETALVQMRIRLPDVVVLDLMMPVLDGFGVLAAMRADPTLAGLPVVVLTAKSLTHAERQFLSRSAVRVLQKGVHRLADVAALVLRAAAHAREGNPVG